jgi:uncharacterized protein YecA (UPF0149 family)
MKSPKQLGEIMKIKQAKEYFEDGVITGFDAVRDPLKPGAWILSISGKNGKNWTFQTALGETRSFAKLDTLVGEIESITGCVSSLRVSI